MAWTVPIRKYSTIRGKFLPICWEAMKSKKNLPHVPEDYTIPKYIVMTLISHLPRLLADVESWYNAMVRQNSWASL